MYFGDTGRFPYGPKPRDEVLEVRARDRRRPARARREGARGRVQQRGGGRARGARRSARRPGDRGDRAGPARRRPRHPDRPHRGDRHRRHDRVGRVPARAPTRPSGAVDLTCARARASSSSSRPATSTPTRCTCSRSGCSRRCRDAGVDTLVLGCTHYPLLARTIGDVMGRDVVLVSSADETAFAVRDLLDGRWDAGRAAPT